MSLWGSEDVSAIRDPITGVIRKSALGSLLPRSIYKGLVATRCGIPSSIAGSNTQFMSRTKHRATEVLSGLQVEFANFYTVTNGGEANPGSSATYTAAVEYPVGTIAAVVTFGGLASGVADDGETLLSDWISLPSDIPEGASFYLRVWGSRSAGILYNGNYGLNDASGSVPLSGEWNVFGNSIADDTQNTTNRNNQQVGVAFKPAAIIGWTSRPTFYIAGDSRCGNGTNYDNASSTQGAVGEIERWLMKRFASFNAGNPGERLQQAATGSSAKRLYFSKYCTHVIVQYGINDFIASYTAAQTEANLYTFAALFGGKPVYVCTVAPKTTSTDGFVTTANQTVDTVSNTNRVAYNNHVRGGLTSPIVGCIEIADQCESARNSGVWKVPGGGASYTSDGLHENNLGARLIETSSAFDDISVLIR